MGPYRRGLESFVLAKPIEVTAIRTKVSWGTSRAADNACVLGKVIRRQGLGAATKISFQSFANDIGRGLPARAGTVAEKSLQWLGNADGDAV